MPESGCCLSVLTTTESAFGFTTLAVLEHVWIFEVFLQKCVIAVSWYQKKAKHFHKIIELNEMLLCQRLLLDTQQKQEKQVTIQLQVITVLQIVRTLWTPAHTPQFLQDIDQGGQKPIVNRQK
jgi:hypothetical protein